MLGIVIVFVRLLCTVAHMEVVIEGELCKCYCFTKTIKDGNIQKQ